MYDNAIHQTYTIPASAIDTAGTKLQIVGPKGLQGHLVSIGAVITTATTVAATIIEIGDGTDKTKYGSLSVPIGVANTVANDATLSTTDKTQVGVVLIAKDARVVIGSDGGATAGDADLTVTIAWF